MNSRAIYRHQESKSCIGYTSFFQWYLHKSREHLPFVQFLAAHVEAQQSEKSDVAWRCKSKSAIIVTMIWWHSSFWKMRTLILISSFKELEKLIVWLYMYCQRVRQWLMWNMFDGVLEKYSEMKHILRTKHQSVTASSLKSTDKVIV